MDTLFVDVQADLTLSSVGDIADAVGMSERQASPDSDDDDDELPLLEALARHHAAKQGARRA